MKDAIAFVAGAVVAAAAVAWGAYEVPHTYNGGAPTPSQAGAPTYTVGGTAR